MAASDESDLVERFVRAALRGNIHVPDSGQLFTEESRNPELAQSLKDFCAAIKIFVGKVRSSRATGPEIELERTATTPEHQPNRPEATQKDQPERTAATSANGYPQATQSPPPSESNPTIPGDGHVKVAYRVKDGVITLLPKNKRQCQDLPLLAAQALELGAGDAGVFKYVLSEDFGIRVTSGQVDSASSFSSSPNALGGFRMTYHQNEEPLTVMPTAQEETEPQILAAQLEDILNDPERLSQMRYCTDHPAQTKEQRLACGLPLQSPIYPLPHNRLDETLYEIDGLHWPFAYLGKGFFTIHREDQETWSVNVLYVGGDVLWLTIDPKDAPVIDKLKTRWSCGQKLRHERVYFTIAELKRLGVSYRLFLQHAKEAVVVFGKTYHQGGNVIDKMAEAVNYGPPTWTVDGYKECKRGKGGCPDCPIPNSFLRFRRPGEAQLRQNDVTESRTDDATRESRTEEATAKMLSKQSTRAVLKLPAKRKDILPLPKPTKRQKLLGPDPTQVQFLRKVDPQRATPRHSGPTVSPPVQKLVSAILSKPAIMAFCDLVRARRRAEKPLGYWDADDSDERQLEHRIRSLREIQTQSVFNKFCVRIHEFELARKLTQQRKGGLRNDSQVVKKMVESSGWHYKKFHRHEIRGRKWLQLFEAYPGLLCFLLVDDHNPFGLSRADYLNLSADDLSTFPTLLACEHTVIMNAIGEKFMRSLSPIADDIEFRWEGEDVRWSKISMPQALEYLAPISWEVDNIYSPEKYPDWLKPPDWPDDWEWPTNPTSVLDYPKCELCPQTQCDCISARFTRVHRMQPRIKDYEDKGRGVRAVARTAGQVAYVEGEHIAVLSGMIAPKGMHCGRMVMDFNHPDILFEPVVCQIYFGQSGHYLRLANHSCRPSARVKVMKVSGQYRLVMTAARDIYDLEEITADFKRESLDRPCLCGAKTCRQRLDGARATKDNCP